ncbi:MAG: hypothetical protein QXJ28_00360 [Candidatus Pacearchaeota archaeon]
MLTGEIKSQSLLNSSEKERMFQLMIRHYSGMKKEKFLNDLSEKDGAIIIRDENNIIQGFSTYLFIETEFRNDKIAVLFSGDTIISKEFWGTPVLFNTFGKLLYKMMNIYPDRKCYWFLITKGYRTYLLLPLYFNFYYPRFDKETPEYEKNLIKHLAELKYKGFFNEKTGIIEAPADYLKDELADIPDHKSENKFVQFFLSKNPDYHKGNELACICEIREESFRNRTKTMIRP